MIMYQAILEVCAMSSMVCLGFYPILFKKDKSWKWYAKGGFVVSCIYVISVVTTQILHLN